MNQSRYTRHFSLIAAAVIGCFAAGAKAEDQASLSSFSADCRASKNTLVKDVKDGQEIVLPEGRRFDNIDAIVEVNVEGKQSIFVCIATKKLIEGMPANVTNKDIRDDQGAKIVTLKIKEVVKRS